MVGLVFGWHEENETPVDELHPTQGGESHVHQDTVENRHRNVLKAESSRSKMETFLDPSLEMPITQMAEIPA